MHYDSNSNSQRVYMSVPNNDEMTDLPVLTCYESTQEVGDHIPVRMVVVKIQDDSDLVGEGVIRGRGMGFKH